MSSNYRVVHFVGGNISGGAAKGALTLHLELLKIGVESLLITNSAVVTDVPNSIFLNRGVLNKFKNFMKKALEKFIPLLFGGRFNSALSPGLVGLSNSQIKKLVQDGDIIHLHWINAGFLKLSSFKGINNPIMWTLRDMWPLTGLCHYSFECDHFREKCGKCPKLKIACDKDLSRLCWIKKNKQIESINLKKVVPISNWLEHSRSKSSLMSKYESIVIPNQIDISKFFIECTRDNAATQLGLSLEKRKILVGATNLNLDYKGFDLFLECVKKIESKEFQIVIFGKLKEIPAELKCFDVKCVGVVGSDTLRKLFNASSVFIAPSKMDAFAKTVGESLACGTPVVCYDNSGPAEIVEHRKSGYLARSFCTKDLAAGVDWVFSEFVNENQRMPLREKVVQSFSPSVVAGKYKVEYDKISGGR